jgi:two-component system chemotaxis response regulator CheY
MKVLVVDDSAVMRKIVIKALNEAGHANILEAGNGKDALEQVGEADIVFTDWNMPVMDGLAFVKEVRKSSAIPIVMITTEGGQKEVLEAMKSGVNDYIVKPFKPTVLLSKLETFLKK